MTSLNTMPASFPSMAVEERRASARIRQKLSMKLAPLGCVDGHCCCAEDISAGGLFVSVPVDYGLAVGQRVEVVLGDDTTPTQIPGLKGETCYATVVRTKPLPGKTQDFIGAGLRFDQPLFLDLA